jgi:Neuraminidase (sialidase)
VGENVYLVWRESEAKTHKILGKYSDDGGRNWSEPKLLAETTGKADYPQLLNRDKQVYLAWQTAQEGLRLIAW